MYSQRDQQQRAFVAQNQDAIAQGIPGATALLCRLAQEPAHTPIAAYLIAERFVGERLWILYKDECGEDYGRFLDYILSGIGREIAKKEKQNAR